MKKPTIAILQSQYIEIHKAYISLHKAVDAYSIEQSDFMRDSVLQRFEYCVEGSWKMGRNILLYQLVDTSNLTSAGQCIRAMKQHHLIDDLTVRTDLIEARNALSHTYSEDKSHEIFDFVIQYIYIFDEMQNTFDTVLSDIHA